jgi:hypothetical protein
MGSQVGFFPTEITESSLGCANQVWDILVIVF